MVQGRSKQAFKTWLSQRPKDWRDSIEVVTMDGFTGFKTATTEELPDAATVMDPFHVVRSAGDALDRCRRRIQQVIHGHRGRKDDPLYRARRTLQPHQLHRQITARVRRLHTPTTPSIVKSRKFGSEVTRGSAAQGDASA